MFKTSIIGVAAILSVTAEASVIICNTNLCYVEHIVVRSEISCPYGYSTNFYCEHYLNPGTYVNYTLNPGECMSLIDSGPGSECTFHYSVANITWVPICGSVTRIDGLPPAVCTSDQVTLTAVSSGGPLDQGITWSGDAVVLSQNGPTAVVTFPVGGTNRTVYALAQPIGPPSGGTVLAQQVPAQATTNSLDVELLNSGNAVTSGSIVYVSVTPQMPPITARLKNSAGMAGTVDWNATVVFDRPDRNDSTSFSATKAASDAWDLAAAFGSNFYGGTLTVSATYKTASGASKQICTSAVAHIRGTNPTVGSLEAYVGTTPWFALPICRHERGSDLQFNIAGTEGPNFLQSIKNTPNRGNDTHGWGAMQLTYLFATGRRATTTELWNWQANIDTGKSHLTTTCLTAAANWIASQEAQQQSEEPSMPLANYIFVFNNVPFQKGTPRTPVDACAIERNNGASQWVIFWRNKTATIPGSWEVNPSFTQYVDLVCGRITQ